MPDACIGAAVNENYRDFISGFRTSPNELRDFYHTDCITQVNFQYAIVYVDEQQAAASPCLQFFRGKCKFPQVLRPHGYAGSGGDRGGPGAAVGAGSYGTGSPGSSHRYRDRLYKSCFRKSDGTTRILGLWDQTLPEDPSVLPPGVPEYYPMGGASYGTEFTHEEINEALTLEDPFSLVPSKDTDGHGTFLAGLAAGTAFPLQNFTGAAPMADLAIVKLKPAKKYLRDYYLISEDTPAFQENDIMMGIKYLRVIADRFRRPLVTLLGLGTNYGSHTGTSPLSQVTQNYGGFFGIATVIAAGNETGLAHHYAGRFSADTSFEDVELRVGEEEGKRGFILELWSSAADLYTVGFVSPGGERISRIPILSNNETRIPFLLEFYGHHGKLSADRGRKRKPACIHAL